jgi:N-acetylmuramic acid 6-phosphate etherase
MKGATTYSQLPTEENNPLSRTIDLLSTSAILRLMNKEDSKVPKAVGAEIPTISKASEIMVKTIKAGGKILFVGAGTSGRLGVIEAAECPPTFNTPAALIRSIIAGGKNAVFRSREGAEDNAKDARKKAKQQVRPNDAVVGIAASGITPFVKEFLLMSKKLGAKTILITCNPKSRLLVDVIIAPRVGPEIISGSTRLKAGTATKLILNMLTVSAMVRLGKVYGNFMVDVRPNSKKLKNRAINIITKLTHCSARTAGRLLRLSHGEVKTAIVMHKKEVNFKKARDMLKTHDGRLRSITG